MGCNSADILKTIPQGAACRNSSTPCWKYICANLFSFQQPDCTTPKIPPLSPTMEVKFQSLLHDASSTAQVGALLGLLLHQAIRNVEFELYMFHSMTLYVASFLGLFYAFAQFGGLGAFAAFARTSLFAFSFTAALLVSIIVYRLFFHRCCSFPGPFGAKITRFYATYLSAKDVQYYKEAEKIHTKYGDFVRTGMTLLWYGKVRHD